jgi:TonB family protein
MSNAFSFLAAAAWKGTIILAAAWAAALLLRGRSAAARHLVWTAAAAALIALPLLSIGLPSLPVPAPAAILDPGLMFRVSTLAPQVQDAALAGARPSAAQPFPSFFDPRPWILLLWASGAAFGLFQMLAAWTSLARIRRSARPLEHAGIPVLDAGPGRMPLAFGIFRPVILLPSESAGWTEERRAVVLRHEIAHVERGDLATHLLARLALLVHWWNPLAWLAWREFLKERERAADDLVLASGARASDYAAHLLEIARAMQSPDRLASAAIAMARPSQLEGRLLAILDSGVNRRAFRRTAPVVAAIAAMVLIAPLAAVRAQQSAEPGVRFRDQVSDAASLVKQGDLAVKNHQFAEADALYAKAASLGDSPVVVRALLYLGHLAEREQNPAAAQGFYERAFNIDPSGPQAGTALNQMAQLKLKQGGSEADAEALYQHALSLQAHNSSAAATTMQLYALLLRKQNRNAEADQYEQQAGQIYRTRIAELTRSSASAGTVHRVGSGVTAPMVVDKVEPEYSEEARAAKFQGTVLLYVEIGPDGLAHNISVKRTLGMGLDEKAIEAVQQWKFRPGAIDSQPTTVAATIEVNFRLL